MKDNAFIAHSCSDVFSAEECCYSLSKMHSSKPSHSIHVLIDVQNQLPSCFIAQRQVWNQIPSFLTQITADDLADTQLISNG